MTAITLPEPRALAVADVARLSSELIAWAETTDDLAAVRDATDRWAAITAYVRRTSRQGIAEAEAALRRLEIRVGKLLGPADLDGKRRNQHSATAESSTLTADARHDLRSLAEHAEIVEEVIAASDDASPPSRRKSLTPASTATPHPRGWRDGGRRTAAGGEHASRSRPVPGPDPSSGTTTVVLIAGATAASGSRGSSAALPLESDFGRMALALSGSALPSLSICAGPAETRVGPVTMPGRRLSSRDAGTGCRLRMQRPMPWLAADRRATSGPAVLAPPTPSAHALRSPVSPPVPKHAVPTQSEPTPGAPDRSKGARDG